MVRTRVIPCLLLRGRGLVKTIRFKDASYVGDPINTVRIYNEKEVDEIIMLDIQATPGEKSPPFDLIAEIAGECFMPLTYGGGVRSVDDARRIFSSGVEKIAVNSRAVDKPEFISELSAVFGNQSVVLSIDVKKKTLGGYEVRTCGGRKSSGMEPVEWAREGEELGAGEILLTSIDRDGTMSGYDLDLIRKVASAVDIPLIACGGAGETKDFADAVRSGGASAVAAGSMVVYQGTNRAVLINFPNQQELSEVLG
jgi:cyclase